MTAAKTATHSAKPPANADELKAAQAPLKAKYREQADYARAFQFTEEDARAEVDNARTICAAIEAALAADGWP